MLFDEIRLQGDQKYIFIEFKTTIRQFFKNSYRHYPNMITK